MKNLDAGTIARLVFLVLSFINMALTMSGYSPIPLDEANINQFVSLLFMAFSSGLAYWKNNNHSQEAQEAQKVLDVKKAEKKIKNAIEEPPYIEETLEDTAQIIDAVETPIEREVDNRGI